MFDGRVESPFAVTAHCDRSVWRVQNQWAGNTKLRLFIGSVAGSLREVAWRVTGLSWLRSAVGARLEF